MPIVNDIWKRGKFRLGVNLFPDRTSYLRGKTLQVVVLDHIPAVTINDQIDLKKDNNSFKIGNHVIDMNVLKVKNQMKWTGVEIEVNYFSLYSYSIYNIITEIKCAI